MTTLQHDTYEEMHRILKEILLEDPDISEAEGKQRLWDSLTDEHCRLLSDNWYLANRPRYLIQEISESSVSVTKQASSWNRGERKKLAKKIIEKSSSIILMNLPMPNGKNLRECTGAQCTRFGGWLADVGKAVGPANKVGKTLTEQQLQNLLKRSESKRAA